VEATRTRVARAAIRTANGVVDVIVLAVVAALVAFSCYTIWDSRQVVLAASATQYAPYKPSAATPPAAGGAAPLAQLQAINPDVLGWLTVYDTGIDFPLVQGKDNTHYLNRDATGKYSGSGSIFLDYRNSPDFTDFSTIIFGHHMKNGAMFGPIGLFYDQPYFDAHQYGSLYFDGQQHGLEFFAFIHTNAYDDSVYTTPVAASGEQAYLTRLMREARFTRPDVTVGADDHIVLLSTCSSRTTNGRDILVGKIVPEAMPDPSLNADGIDTPSSVATVDAVPNLWVKFPLWAKLTVMIVPVILLLVLLHRKRHHPLSTSSCAERSGVAGSGQTSQHEQILRLRAG